MANDKEQDSMGRELPTRDFRWFEDPNHPVSDWQYEVANGDTRLGYREWVGAGNKAQNHQRAAEKQLGQPVGEGVTDG